MIKQIEIIIDIETIPSQRNYDVNISDIIYRKMEQKKEDNFTKYMSLNWEFNQIICIGYKINSGEVHIILNENEDRLLIDFFKVLEEYNLNDLKFITFNGKRFDIPIINLHSSLLNIKIPFIISNRRYDIYKHYDVLEILTNFYQNQNFLNLQEYCNVFGIENNDNSNGSNIYQLFQEKEFNKIKQHCIKDIEATKKLYDRIKNYS